MNMRILSAAVLLTLLSIPAFSGKEKKIVNDDTIYNDVRRKLADDPDVKGGALEVEVHNGAVTIKGKVETDHQRTKAERDAKKIKGVTSVTNQITLSNR